MKKLLVRMTVLVLAALSLSGCASKKHDTNVEVVSEEIVSSKSGSKESAVKNLEPDSKTVELTGIRDIENKLGISMTLPAGATETVYSLIDDDVAQITFSYNGIAYTYRGSKLCKDQALDGIYDNFTDGYFNIDLNGSDFELYTAVNGNRLASWSIDEVNYSLYSGETVENTVLENLLLSMVFGEDSFDTALATAEDMQPIFHGLNGYLYSHDNKYSPNDDTAYWTCLCYVVSTCQDLLKDNCTLTGDEYKITPEALASLAASLYGTRQDITEVPIPADAADMVRFDEKENVYYITAGDLGAVNTVITFAIKSKDGALMVESQYIDPEDDSVLAIYHYTLDVTTGEEAGMFPYTIRKVSSYGVLEKININKNNE